MLKKYLPTPLKSAIAVLALLTAPAFAEESDAEKRLNLAREMFELSQVEQLVDQMTAQMAPMQLPIMKAALPEGALTDAQLEELVRKTSEIMAEELRPAMASLISQMAPIYADVLSLEELEAIVAFYKSPAGVALTEKQPEIVRRSTNVSIEWAQETMPTVMARAKPRLDAMMEEMRAEASAGDTP